ncbi:MAG: DNA polymerase Y family protein [Arachnia sp.]
MVLWFPHWPVTAWELETGADPEVPTAVVEANWVTACSPAAFAYGVRPGLRRREAQSRCPQVRVVVADPGRDAHQFAPLVDLVEEAIPGAQVIRPGELALLARGPARYYGGERQAAIALLERVAESNVFSGRVGVADGVFTATQAARDADPILVVPPGGSAAFLAPRPIGDLGEPDLVALLPRLGIRRLGEFAAMDVGQVRDRLGDRGVRLHALAGGSDSRNVQPRTPPTELAREVSFEPPLNRVDQVAFSSRATAEEFIAGLAALNLVCTELQIVVTTEEGEQSVRTWLHPGCFDSAAVIDRVRWQLDGAGKEIESGVAHVRFEPVATDALAHHDPGLFGDGSEEKVHHVLARVQSMLGHAGVQTPIVGGGRWLTDRQVLVPWGDRARLPHPPDRPWPGSLPDPLPATVFPQPRKAEVLDADGVRVRVDDRLLVTGVPAQLLVGAARLRTAGWAGPWPIAERGWDPERARTGCRFQMADDTGGAWLLMLDGTGEWWAEGRYD